MPEPQDKRLEDITKSIFKPCEHEWVDTYGGPYEPKDGSNIMLVYFYCKFCLNTRLVKLDSSQLREYGDYE